MILTLRSREYKFTNEGKYTTMNTNSKKLTVYMVLMLIGAAVSTTLRTIACISHLDYSTGYFKDKSLISVADIIIWVTVILMLTYPIITSKAHLHASFSTGATYIPSGALAVAVVFAGVQALSYAMSISRYPLLSLGVFKTPSAVIGIAVFILSLATVAYLFFNTYLTRAKSDIRAYFAVCAIAFFAAYAILIYLDSSLSNNSHGKIVNQMAFLFTSLFFLYEARISLGREMWRAYTTFGLMAAALSAYSSIPAIVTYYVKHTLIFAPAGVESGFSLEGCIVLLMIFIFTTARLSLTVTLSEEKESKLIKAMSEYAQMREERVDESFERHQQIFAARQLDIFELYGDEEPIEEAAEQTEEHLPEPESAEEVKETVISDDAIYEAIFGKMPEKPKEDPKPKESDEERDPEAVADDILSAVDEALKDENADKDE